MTDGSVAPLALSPGRVRDQAHALRFDDRIVAVDGVPVAGAADVRAAVERVGSGVPLRYTVERGGRHLDATIDTVTFTASDYAELFLPLLLGGLVGMALGLLPVLMRPDSTPARLFFLANFGLAVNFAFLAPNAYVTHLLPRVGFVFVGLATGAFLHLALTMASGA